MISIKVKFRASSLANGEGTLYYQVCCRCTVRLFSTRLRLLASEWDDAAERVVLPAAEPSREMKLRNISSRLSQGLERLRQAALHLEAVGAEFSADDVLKLYNGQEKSLSFSQYMQRQVERLHLLGRARTSETYASTLRSLTRFRRGDVLFSDFGKGLTECYEAWLRSRSLTPNTISFYMRILRATYNRAVGEGLASDTHPFRSVFTGKEQTAKRAVSMQDIRRIALVDLSESPALDFARDMFMFSFCTRGMSFVDMAYLRWADLSGGVLVYRRKKTGQRLAVRWEEAMQRIVSKYPLNPTGYLLPIITQPLRPPRVQYANAQRRVNNLLKKVGQTLSLPMPLTMYVARHSWASIAWRQHIPISIISEGMGHESESTTRIYLASLDSSEVDNANLQILKLL